MPCVLVSIGSNIERYRHISAGLDALAEFFGALQLSRVYESEAVGFDGSNFLNMVAAFDTDMALEDVSSCLKQIEDNNGRVRGGPKFAARTLDIDILTYDDLAGSFAGISLPRDEITKNAFVLLPLSEVAPEGVHPSLGLSYLTMWQEYSGNQKLWPVPFDWNGLSISSAE